MVNTRKLRARIIEKGMTYEEMSQMLGISSCTFGKKIRNIAEMSLSEAELIIKILNIPMQDVLEYFFYDTDFNN